MRFTPQKINNDTTYTQTPQFTNTCRGTNPQNFTRNRKMPPQKLIQTLLNKKGTTTSTDLRRYHKITNTKPISKPGYLKQREKLNPKAIQDLTNYHNTNFYNPQNPTDEKDIQTLKNYLILAGDGSSINIPTTKETLKKYGNNSKPQTKTQAALGLHCLYDVLNKIILSTSINRNRFNEIIQLQKHIEKISPIINHRKTILTLDRAYPSLTIFAPYLLTNQKFIVRLKKADFLAERETMQTNDQWLTIPLTKARMAHYKGTPLYDLLKQMQQLTLRIVNISLEGDEMVSVATNLSELEFSSQEISQLYGLRWGVEQAFDMLKNQLQIENFTGTKPILLEQDVFSCVYLCNLAQDMIFDAQQKYDAQQKSMKHKMVINRAFAVGVLKDDFLGALVESDFVRREGLFLGMVEALVGVVLPVRPGRHFPRVRRRLASKFSNTRKRCF